jgi:hypothetical protein
VLQAIEFAGRLETRIAETGPNLKNSLLISLLAGNLTMETSPIRTASSASQCGLCDVISRCGRTADIPEGYVRSHPSLSAVNRRGPLPNPHLGREKSLRKRQNLSLRRSQNGIGPVSGVQHSRNIVLPATFRPTECPIGLALCLPRAVLRAMMPAREPGVMPLGGTGVLSSPGGMRP